LINALRAAHFDEERMLANLKKAERRSRNRRDPDARFSWGPRNDRTLARSVHRDDFKWAQGRST
jgi:hypothetical protein